MLIFERNVLKGVLGARRGKKCQKWIGQAQNASKTRNFKNGDIPGDKYGYIPGDKYGDIPGDTTTWGYPLLIPGRGYPLPGIFANSNFFVNKSSISFSL